MEMVHNNIRARIVWKNFLIGMIHAFLMVGTLVKRFRQGEKVIHGRIAASIF